MTIGDLKLKKIRTFRNMTQTELRCSSWTGAIKVQTALPNMKLRCTGFPVKIWLTEMAKILGCESTVHCYDTNWTMNASELMEILFWIDEFNPWHDLHLFQSQRLIQAKNANSSG